MYRFHGKIEKSFLTEKINFFQASMNGKRSAVGAVSVGKF